MGSHLHLACESGQSDIVRTILDNTSTEINERNPDGATPLFVASQRGHQEVVRMLLARGADVRIARFDGVDPKEIARRNGHDVVFRLIAKYM